jgi:uncharacterized protein (DUF58 family)
LKLFRNIYIEQNLFTGLAIIVVFFVVSYFLPQFLFATKIGLLSWLTFAIMDFVVLFWTHQGITAKRLIPEKFSNGDENPIQIHLINYYTFPIYTKIIDEIPFQFQKRDFMIHQKTGSASSKSFYYNLRPTERGEYWFGKLIVYVQSPFRLLSRRFNFGNEEMVPTYPSFIQLRKFDLIALTYRSEYGIKRVRRIGHTMEFEQIKEYVLGDDIRTINWKATAKKNRLMVNQFQDEKSQPIYSIIDKGRMMKMPFNELSLLDYAINATLVISNVSLKKHDKAGMLCFSKKVENRVVAERRESQMNLIMETLYNVKTDYWESDFGRLYSDLKRNMKQRSLLFLYTNFETLDGMDRQLAYLQAIAKQHVLVVIFFVNTEMDQLIHKKAEDVKEIYNQTIAEKFAFEKRLIVKALEKRGVYSILTKPEHLTLKVINKYLEFKAKGII